MQPARTRILAFRPDNLTPVWRRTQALPGRNKSTSDICQISVVFCVVRRTPERFRSGTGRSRLRRFVFLLFHLLVPGMFKFIKGKGPHPTAERQKLQKELFSYRRVSRVAKCTHLICLNHGQLLFFTFILSRVNKLCLLSD